MSLLSIKKKGYLHKLPVKGMVKKWNKRWFVLHATTLDGVVRIDYYDNEEFEATEMGKRTIPLRDCMGVSQAAGSKTHPYVFELTSQIGHHVFATTSQSDLDEWLATIKEAVREDRMKMKTKKTKTFTANISKTSQDESDSHGEGRTFDNTIYDTSMPMTSGTYRVTLEQNATAQRLNLTGAYNLEVTPHKLTLIAANSGASMAVWQYTNIKTYGRGSGKVNLETGKVAETGAGSFIFITSCSKEVFGVIHRNIKKLRIEKEQRMAERQQQEPAKARGAVMKHRSSTAAKYSMTDARSRPRPKKSAPDPGHELTTGTYRRSKHYDWPEQNEEVEDPHVYDEVAPDEDPIPDSSHLYAEVRKPKERISTDSRTAGLPPKLTYPKQDMYRLSYGSSRDSRDSTVLAENPLAVGDDLPPLTSGVENPLTNEDMSFVVTNIDDFDDELFETLAEMELHDEVPSLSGKSGPKVGSTNGGGRKVERRLSQQEFDHIWDNICATIPDTDEFS